MKTLAPWGGELKREMERFFDRFAEPMWGPFEGMAGDWAPRVDISETKDAYVVRAEMRGVDPKEIEIGLTGDVLTMKVRRKGDREERGALPPRRADLWGLPPQRPAAANGGGRNQGHRDVQERTAGRDAAEDAGLEGDDDRREARVEADVSPERH